jgi:hypothetical protein
MAKGYREGGVVHLDKYICDGCRGIIEDYDEIYCKKCRNNLIVFIHKLEERIKELEKEQRRTKWDLICIWTKRLIFGRKTEKN